jgi:methylglyoxal/glyoxal reductase
MGKMHLTITSKKKLNNGTEIPYFGFGTYQIRSSAAKEAVESALEAGYRHIDTASIYGNEKEVGEALKASGVPKEEVFITTKLWNEDQGYNTAFEAFQRSLDRLDIEYIDLYIIHWPVTGKRLESWRAMEEIVNNSRCRAIGVSNYTIKHLEELLENCKIKPAVNQVEFNPFLYQKDLLDYCISKDILLEAYTPLSRGQKLDHPVLRNLSGKYHKTPAQILLRWSLEHDLVVIPKSSQKKRINENASIFDFSIEPTDMVMLDSLNEGFRVAWDPSRIE